MKITTKRALSTVCPKCDNPFQGYKCVCGYTLQNQKDSEQEAKERAATLAIYESIGTEKARQWLKNHNIIRAGMTRDEELAAMKSFRETLGGGTFGQAQETPKAWAQGLWADYHDGIALHPCQVKMMMEVMNPASEAEV